MSTIQHDVARRRNPTKNGRMVAQVCDLLDAAAMLASVPPLALTAVRESSGKINPKAWKEWPEYKSQLVKQSLNHRFTIADSGKMLGGTR